MKYGDIKKIQAAGLITPEQEKQIIEHFKLKEEGGRFLAIISFVGAALVACGIILLIAANWDDIPRGVKIAAGLTLMLGAHAGGRYLREVNGQYRKSGEALHFVGAALFLGNIGLIGQIYHLSAHPPSAILLWWVGIAALPWLLRSRAIHILSLSAFALWFGLEINQEGSPMYFGGDELQLLLYAMLGLAYLGFGYCLRRSSFSDFAPSTEKLGLLGFQCLFYPLTWGVLYQHSWNTEHLSAWILPLLAVVTMGLLAVGLGQARGLNTQWRWAWGGALAGALGLLILAAYFPWNQIAHYDSQNHWFRWVCTIGMFVFCLLEIQVGIQQRSEYMVNLGVAFIALVIVATYLNLFGSMARTGVMFLVSGVFLILFGIYLEKKRRALLHKMELPPPASGLVPAAH
jgi:uncharacterized membrane protein